jgi:tetratricopeptide (TPR) repeat protein
MRTTTYMGVDARYDHSMRVPRVDYSIAYGVPNACTTPCHVDKRLPWAADAVVKWYGPTRARGNDYVAALSAARKGQPEAERLLRLAVLDADVPPIARATALESLAGLLSPASMDALYAGLTDEDALLRATAARVLEQAPAADRWRLGSALLADPVRLVRTSAAVALAETPPSLLSTEESAKLERATREAVAAELAVAERPEAHVNLSNLYARRGLAKEAEDELNVALRLDPRNIPALVNLADLCRATAREPDAVRLLEKAAGIEPDAAEVVHALGLAYIRSGRTAEALSRLERAFRLRPGDSRYGYAYAVGLDSVGKTAEAVDVLTTVHRLRPADREVLVALASYEAKRGQWSAAIGWAQQLVALRPEDAEARALLSQIQQSRRRGAGR